MHIPDGAKNALVLIHQQVDGSRPGVSSVGHQEGMHGVANAAGRQEDLGSGKEG